MAFIEKARTMVRYLPSFGNSQDVGIRTQPECIVLGVREGVTPSAKPPVRIFLGTQLAQYRAERVFFWSVEQVRDPSREYEIYLMKELRGFNRRGWLTGFTNYRFAIPHFAGGSGKAIYNDVDQVYLGDPGELFDTDMGTHGYLSLSDRDTAVMLIDCQRMATVWSLAEAQHERRSTLEAKARTIPGLCGPLNPIWHTRDAEYVANQSKLLHYTAIHMQPWQPTPHRYSYQRNPAGHVWFDLERAADLLRGPIQLALSYEHGRQIGAVPGAAVPGRILVPGGPDAGRAGALALAGLVEAVDHRGQHVELLGVRVLLLVVLPGDRPQHVHRDLVGVADQRSELLRCLEVDH